jgi:hypothetical protein
MGGGRRREHHRREEAKREATRQANEFERQLQAQDKQNQALIEALKPGEQKYTPPPANTGALLGMRGVKPRTARKSSALGSRRGIAQLRIPLNVGQSSGGTNIG